MGHGDVVGLNESNSDKDYGESYGNYGSTRDTVTMIGKAMGRATATTTLYDLTIGDTNERRNNRGASEGPHKSNNGKAKHHNDTEYERRTAQRKPARTATQARREGQPGPRKRETTVAQDWRRSQTKAARIAGNGQGQWRTSSTIGQMRSRSRSGSSNRRGTPGTKAP